ncbi:unnamed protein product [Arctogadus glacialis]
MGCTPSKSVGTYNQDRVYGDMETCSTVVSSLKTSVSTAVRPSPSVCVETSSGKQTFLNVPGRDIYGRSVSHSSPSPEAWSTLGTAASSGRFSLNSNSMDADYHLEDTVPPTPTLLHTLA